jgi:hypothetical protein
MNLEMEYRILTYTYLILIPTNATFLGFNNKSSCQQQQAAMLYGSGIGEEFVPAESGRQCE